MNARKRFFVVSAAMALACFAGRANAEFENPIPATAIDDPRDVGDTSDLRGSCVTVIPLGMLSSGGGSWSGDNSVAGNNFQNGSEPNCQGSSYGGTGGDLVYSFTVDSCGIWTFDTGCVAVTTTPDCLSSGYVNCTDTSLRLGCGGACPGGNIACNGDACPSYLSVVSKKLTSSPTYYLVVDSFNSNYDGPFEVAYSKAPGSCCTSDAACAAADGLFCNGQERCDACTGTCVDGPDPCSGLTTVCDEANDVCLRCTTNAHCGDDGVFCNGAKLCQNNTCITMPPPCAVHQSCDEANDICVDPDPCVAWRSGTDVRPGNFSPQWFNTCRGGLQGDDIQLGTHAGRELISYKFFTQARNLGGNPSCCPGAATQACCHSEPIGTPYTITSELWTVRSGGDCTPDAPIPGSRCVFSPGVVQPGGTGADVVLCEPNGGLPTGVFLPDGDDDPITGQCGVDVYLMIVSGNDGAGFSIDRAEQDIGGPAMDDQFDQSVVVFEDCRYDSHYNLIPAGTFSFGAFSAPLVSDIRGAEFCTVPEGPCCATDGGCSITQRDNCEAAGGTYLGDNAIGAVQTCASPDNDHDGSRNECDLCDTDPMKTHPGICGCGVSDVDTDGDGVADCNDNCPTVANANQENSDSDSHGDACDNCVNGANDDQANTDGDINGDACDICPGFDDALDNDGDGTPDGCDGCPDDPNKTHPLACGCGNAETGDSDGDGVSDCVDQCPGVADAVFAPGCVGAIPTVSQWGLIVLALLLLVAGKVYFGRRSITT